MQQVIALKRAEEMPIIKQLNNLVKQGMHIDSFIDLNNQYLVIVSQNAATHNPSPDVADDMPF